MPTNTEIAAPLAQMLTTLAAALPDGQSSLAQVCAATEALLDYAERGEREMARMLDGVSDDDASAMHARADRFDAVRTDLALLVADLRAGNA
jgi:hypothetical protein